MVKSRQFTRCMGRWLMTLVLVMLTSLAMRAAEAYACYTPSHTTLTFYYDNYRSSRSGTTYNLPESGNYPGWMSDYTNKSVTRVVFNSSFAQTNPYSTSYWFYGMVKLTSITGMNQYLRTLLVTDMSYMFCQCSKLTSVDVSSFNTSNVTNMASMFAECSALTSLDVSHFNTDKVTNMQSMFANCQMLTSLDVSSFNTDRVTNMNGMFNSVVRLTHLDLKRFNTSKVTQMVSMFQNCIELTTIDVSSWWSTATVTSSSSMFSGCYNLVGGRGTVYSANHVDKAYAHIDGGPSNPGYLTDPYAPKAYACYTPSNTTLTFYYDNQRDSRTGTTYDLNEGDNNPGWYDDGTNANVTRAVFDPSFANARPTTTYSWFDGMNCLTSITGMKEYLNTSEVTDMGFMFNYCLALTSLDVSGFNTSNVTNMKYMFYGCEALPSLDVSGFNTAKVTNISYMFSDCYSLTSLDVSGFNTSNVTNMGFMFNYCYALTSLDVSGFNTANVTSMYYMFAGCSALTSLDLSSFNTANVTNMNSMFLYCSNLSTIYVGNEWSTASVTNSTNMFYNCTSLVGGQGTTYNANHVDKEYAHIDGGPSNPGYLTDPYAPKAYACYTPSNTTLTFYYDYQRSSRTGTTYDLNEGSNNPGWQSDGTNANVTRAVFDPSFAGARPTTTYRWFYHMDNLQSISGMNYLNTSEVTDMRQMFSYCLALTSLDLSSFNTAKVTTMRYMFDGCKALTSLDVSSLNTSNVTDMHGMFYNCNQLTSLDVSSFNTSNVTDMSYMIYGCYKLATIYVGNSWSTVAVTNSADMFLSCTRLVGGQGTVYNASHVDKEYAHIDGGAYYPGYFSRLIRGDVNHDGLVNVADVTALIQIILNSMPVDHAVADLNNDRNVNVADVTALIQIILNQ